LVDATRGVAMQHQLSNSNASTTIGRVESSPTGNLASARLARSAETEASRAMQFKQARNFSKVKPEARERIRLVETALRVAAEGCVPQAWSGNSHGERQLFTRTPSSGAKRFTKSRIVAYKPCARATDSWGGCLARRDSVGGYVATESHTIAGPDGAGLPRSHRR
jgi:hypothetical protein